MRNRRSCRISIGEGTIIIRIPISYTTVDEKGLLIWKVKDKPQIVNPVPNFQTPTIIKDALKSFPKEFNTSTDEITVEIPVSYESLGNGKLGWRGGTAIIGSPANRDMTIKIIRSELML